MSPLYLATPLQNADSAEALSLHWLVSSTNQVILLAVVNKVVGLDPLVAWSLLAVSQVALVAALKEAKVAVCSFKMQTSLKLAVKPSLGKPS